MLRLEQEEMEEAWKVTRSRTWYVFYFGLFSYYDDWWDEMEERYGKDNG